jgi:hypothetical protein
LTNHLSAAVAALAVSVWVFTTATKGWPAPPH